MADTIAAIDRISDALGGPRSLPCHITVIFCIGGMPKCPLPRHVAQIICCRLTKIRKSELAMHLIFKRRKSGLIRRIVNSFDSAQQRYRDAREARKTAIHPSFLDDFGI
jgi:hypothetical protein